MSYRERYSHDIYKNLLVEYMKQASSISFALLMNRQIKQSHGMANDWSMHIRDNQPCYGELSKYKSVHGDEATQKHNRPTDLYWPFPDGKPIHLALPFHQYNKDNKAVELLVKTAITSDSPWITGFGSVSNVEFVMDGDKFLGVILKRLNVDPTVLVNLLNHLKSCMCYPLYYGKITQLLDLGITGPELHVLLNLNSYQLNSKGHGGDDYYSPESPSLKRYFMQMPRDLTGGTLEDRYDYNRKELHECFSTDNTPFSMQKHFVWSDDPETLVKNWKDAITKFMENEPDPIIEKYIPYNQKPKATKKAA